tara:strand:+ start:1065 stop:2183 length:1119 start_codon:yes stop_codon:yes gene_type:complete
LGKTLKIKSVKLKNFRNYESLGIKFHPKLNYVFGKNGSGKTNLIESIYFLTNLKSFRTKKRSSLIKKNTNAMYVGGVFSDDDMSKDVKLEASLFEQKRVYKLNNKTEQNLIDYLKSVNTMVFFPDSLRIIKDSPLFRRNFFDRAISSIDPTYLLENKEYSRILRERNKILKNNSDDRLLDVWNSRFFSCASNIFEKRTAFLELLKQKIGPLKKTLNINKNIEVFYSKSLKYSHKKNTETLAYEIIKEEYEKNKEEEKIKKQTCLGPHLDDFVIYLDGDSSRENASQGEQRLVIILILLAVSDVYREVSEENLIYLFDDMSSELDREKRQSVIEYLMSSDSQVFITSTEKPETKNPPEAYSFFDLDLGRGIIR